MVNYTAVELNHIVLFENDHTVFAAGRERENNHIRVFLVNERTGSVYSRNGRADAWEEVYGENRSALINNIYSARSTSRVPVYRLNTLLG